MTLDNNIDEINPFWLDGMQVVLAALMFCLFYRWMVFLKNSSAPERASSRSSRVRFFEFTPPRIGDPMVRLHRPELGG